MTNDTQLEELAKAYDALPTCDSHTQYDYSCIDCVKLAHPDSQTVEEWAGLPTDADWQQWEEEQAEVSERLTLKADAFDKAMSDPDSLPSWQTDSGWWNDWNITRGEGRIDTIYDPYDRLPDAPPELIEAATSPDRIRGTGNTTHYPAILETPSGTPIILEGMLHWISSRPGRGKTWLGLMAAEKVLERGGRVALIDYDQPPPESWGERSRTLGGDVLLDNLTDQRAALHFLGAISAQLTEPG